VDSSEEVSRRFIVTGCDCPKLLQGSLDFAIALWRDNRGLACREQGLDHALVGIESFVANSVVACICGSSASAPQIMRLTLGQEEGNRIAQGIHQRMDFGAQSAFAAPDRLVFTFFFGRQHYARARSCCRSWRIRYLHRPPIAEQGDELAPFQPIKLHVVRASVARIAGYRFRSGQSASTPATADR